MEATFYGDTPIRIYTPEEARRKFRPICERIFFIKNFGVTEENGAIFRDPTWPRVIIGGGLMESDLRDEDAGPDDAPTLEEDLDPEDVAFLEVDSRDPLQPLFDILAEDGVEEIIHMSPATEDPDADALTAPASRDGVEILEGQTHAMVLADRLIFDCSSQWGLFTGCPNTTPLPGGTIRRASGGSLAQSAPSFSLPRAGQAGSARPSGHRTRMPIKIDDDQTWIYTHEEARREFFPVCRQIFLVEDGGVNERNSAIFKDRAWPRVIIGGGLVDSDHRDMADRREEDKVPGLDARDELQPLFDLLAEMGVEEVVQMNPRIDSADADAVACPPRRSSVEIFLPQTLATLVEDRVIFDRSASWGLYTGSDLFGLLGGTPEFMARYIEKAGGMAYIRAQADIYWQDEIDDDGYEAGLVPQYYALAGWDNPPRKRS